jgi:hypothetical protein
MPFDALPIPPGARGIDPRSSPVERAREALERRRAARPGDAASRPEDEAEISSLPPVDPGEAVRDLKGNEDQEAHEDRREQGYYTLRGAQDRETPPQRRIDVSG